MISVIDLFLRAVHAKSGAIVQWVVGGIIGFLTALAIKQGVTLDPAFLADLEKWLSIGGAAAVSFAVQWYQSHQAQKVQKALGVQPDGWIGPVTVEAAKNT